MFFDIFLWNLLKPFCLFEGENDGGSGDGDGDSKGDGDNANSDSDDSPGSDDSDGNKGKDESKEAEGSDKEDDKGKEGDKKLPEDFDQAKWDKLKEVDPERWDKLKDIDLEKNSEAMELLESVSKDEKLYDEVLKTIQNHKEKTTDPETQKRLDALEQELGERKSEEAKGKFETTRDEITTEIVKETSLKELSEFEKDYLNRYVLDQFKGKDLKIDQMKTVVKEAVERLEKNHRDRLKKSVKKQDGPDPIKGGGDAKEKEGRNLKDADARVKDSFEFLSSKSDT